MKTSGRLEVIFHELDRPDLMIFHGSKKRRKRLRPESLMVKWDQCIGTDSWRLWHVFLMGELVRDGSNASGAVTLFERGKWAEVTPEWVKGLVDQSMPTHRAVA